MSDEAFRAPSERLWVARRLELALGALPVGAAAVGAGFVAGGAGAALGVLAGWIVLVMLVATGLRRRVRSWGYREREDDLIVRRGVLVRRLSIVPYGRMQFIDVTAGPVDRWFGLATVRLHTAAAASDARIPGLETVEAHRLRDTLAALGEARATGL